MPFTLRPYRRFPVCCSVTYNMGPFLKLPLAYCLGFWPSHRSIRLLVITLLLLTSVPAYRECVQVAGNDQAGMAVAQLNLTPVLDHKPAAVVPVPRTESWWTTQHEDTLARIRQGEVDLLMIGDSITQGWADEGRRIWDAYYGRRRAVNLGFNGDRTEHVLWRLDHDEIEGIAPKLVVIMIGTNNTSTRHDPPAETAAGIQAILTTLRTRLPGTKILLLGVFPRSASADNPLRRVNAAINDRISAFADNQHVFFLDLSRHFLDDQGRLSHDLMPDYLHPSERGYQVWADGMQDMIRKLLDE
jgi:lysophospholipase L1-like esterase